MRRLALLLALASCSKAARHAPPPAPPPAHVDAPVKTPSTDPERMSLFEPVGGHCQWLSVDGRDRVPASDVIADFPGDCTSSRVAFAPDRSHALIWFMPGETQPRHRLWQADIGRGTKTELTLPVDGELEELGYDKDGRAIALTEDHEPKLEHDAKGAFLTYQGRTFRPPEGGDGLPVIVHAYQLASAGWRLVDTAASTTGADLSAGVSLLNESARLCSRSAELLTPHPEGDEVSDPAELGRLRRFAPDLVKEGSWLRLPAEPGLPTVYVWQFEAEFLWASKRIAWVQPDGSLGAPPDLRYAADDPIALQRSGRYLLIARASEGDRPRLFDLKTLQLTWFSESAHAATFWPRTVCLPRPP